MPTLHSHNGYYLWHYVPNRPAAIIVTVIFSILTTYHLFLVFKRKSWFCIPFVVGGIFETIGYIGRVLAYNASGDLLPYILQSTFILIAPVLFAASLYMTLSRVISFIPGGEQHAIVSPRWLTRIFVAADVISFLVQAGGAGILVKGDSSKSSAQLGQNIIIGGLVFQLLAFAAFLTSAVTFHIRVRQYRCGMVTQREESDVPWQSLLAMLYLTSALIIVRNVVRAVEYATGVDGYLMTHEWCIYVFDGVAMMFTMIAFAWRYPCHVRRFMKHESAIELMPQK